MLLPDELFRHLPQIDWQFGVAGVGSDHRVLAEQRLDVRDDSLLLAVVSQAVLAVVQDDVGYQVGCGLDSCVLVDFALSDCGIRLDVWNNDSASILIADWPSLFMAHNDVYVVDGLVWVH